MTKAEWRKAIVISIVLLFVFMLLLTYADTQSLIEAIKRAFDIE